jgi:hypothetical protein
MRVRFYKCHAFIKYTYFCFSVRRNINKRVVERNLRTGDHLGDPGVDGRIILKWIFKTWDRAWTGLRWLRTGTVTDCCECGNEPPGSIKCGEFLD